MRRHAGGWIGISRRTRAALLLAGSLASFAAGQWVGHPHAAASASARPPSVSATRAGHTTAPTSIAPAPAGPRSTTTDVARQHGGDALNPTLTRAPTPHPGAASAPEGAGAPTPGRGDHATQDQHDVSGASAGPSKHGGRGTGDHGDAHEGDSKHDSGDNGGG